MNTTLKIGIIIIILVIIGSAGYYFWQKPEELPPEITPVEEKLPPGEKPLALSICENISDQDIKNACIGGVTENITLCNGGYECYTAVAILKNDPSICEKGPSPSLCYWNFALVRKNVSFCFLLSDRDRDSCLLKLAEIEKNFSFCGLIIDSTFSTGCYDALFEIIKPNKPDMCKAIALYYEHFRCENDIVSKYTDDIEECKKISVPLNKYRCLARVTNNVSICDEMYEALKDNIFINTLREKDECYSEVYSKVAMETKDLTLCEKIDDTFRKEKCFRDIAVETKNISICEKIESDYKFTCYSIIAKVTGDANICEDVPLRPNVIHCYEMVAVSTENATLCEKLTDRKDKERCFRKIAELTNDTTLCQKLDDLGVRASCVTEIASKTGDASGCEILPQGYFKDYCYLVAAYKTMNVELLIYL